MVSSEAILPDEEAPNSAASDWDMSDVEGPYSGEPERNYEARERLLKDQLLAVVKKRAGFINETGMDFVDILGKSGHPMMDRIDSNFDGLTSGKRLTSQATLESFFNYVDAMFPPEFSGIDRDQKLIETTESDYRRDARREGIDTSEKTEELAGTFRYDASEKDLQIATKLDNIKQDAEDYFVKLPDAIIGYANTPNEKNRKHIADVQSSHEGVLSKSLFNIANVFDSSRTKIGETMFNATLVLMSGLTTGSDEYYNGLMDYLKFKIDHTYDKYKSQEDPAESDETPQSDQPMV